LQRRSGFNLDWSKAASFLIFFWQVGQESNLQPAVLEFVAAFSPAFTSGF